MRDRRLAIIFAIVLVNMLSFSIVLPLLPYLANELGANAAQIGLLTAMYPLAQVFAAPLMGRLSDRFGRKPVLVVSILGTAAGFVVLALARWLPILFVSRLLDGATGGNISVAQAYIADITDKQSRGKALGLIGAAFGLGFVLGPVTGGLLSRFGYAVPAWAGAGLALLNAVVVLVWLPESLTQEARTRLAARARKLFDTSGIRTALAHKRVGPLLGIRFATGISFAIFQTSFSLWAINALGIDADVNGAVLGYIGALSVFTQAFLIGRLTARFSDDALVLTALSFSGITLVAWGFVPSIPLLLLLMPALAIALAVTNTMLTSALSKSVHRDEIGSIMGTQTSMLSFTRIPAPIIAGLLIERVAVWAPGLLAGSVALAMVPFAYRTLCWRPGNPSCDAEEYLSVIGPTPLDGGSA